MWSTAAWARRGSGRAIWAGWPGHCWTGSIGHHDADRRRPHARPHYPPRARRRGSRRCWGGLRRRSTFGRNRSWRTALGRSLINARCRTMFRCVGKGGLGIFAMPPDQNARTRHPHRVVAHRLSRPEPPADAKTGEPRSGAPDSAILWPGCSLRPVPRMVHLNPVSTSPLGHRVPGWPWRGRRGGGAPRDDGDPRPDARPRAVHGARSDVPQGG